MANRQTVMSAGEVSRMDGGVAMAMAVAVIRTRNDPGLRHKNPQRRKEPVHRLKKEVRPLPLIGTKKDNVKVLLTV